MATIEIDGKIYEAEPGQMLIEITDAAGIDIPRFCYHKKLSVAANCRMCLVEVEKAPKPLPACATPIMDGMKVHTRSSVALFAQKAVMEFLLINHPLDCPICDQGGECELQDIAMGYGGDTSRYHELKRVVPDKNIGPLIATEMTRCIHCTRCVRFGVEIAGVQELGATGRGEHTRIGLYVESTVNSELSGNVIDLCPVGALTAKPSRYAARAWEVQQYDGIAPHDSVGSNIHLHVRRGDLIRVVPKENEEVNEVWISDRDRFSYLGLKSEDRLTSPMIKKDGVWLQTDWETALTFAADGIKNVLANRQAAESLGALVSPTATVEEFYLLQKLVRALGSNNIDHRLRQTDFLDQNQAPLFPWLGQSIADLEKKDAVLLVGSNLRKEQPLLNHRLRKASIKNNAAIMAVNPAAFEFNYPLAVNITAAPTALLDELSGIAKALWEKAGDKANITAGMQKLLKGHKIKITEQQRAVAESLNSAGNNATVLLGCLAMNHSHFSILRALAGSIAELSGACLGYVGELGNSCGAWLAGAIPHRRTGGAGIKEIGKNALQMLENTLPAYILLGLEPELDSCLGETAMANLAKADFTISLTAYETSAMKKYANVLLPIGLFAETSGTHINCEGRRQTFNGAIAPPGEARPAWKVLRVLGNLFNLEDFDYISSGQVRDEMYKALEDKEPDNIGAWRNPQSLSMDCEGIQAFNELSIYATDSITRRSGALQNTADAINSNGVRINHALAAQLHLNAGDKAGFTANGSRTVLDVQIDPRLPDNCALIYGGHPETLALGGATRIEINPA